LIVIISGPGGVGKGTVVDRLLKMAPDLHLSRSWTTRPQRLGEADGAYEFVTREAFQRRIAEGGFLEWTESASMPGHLYGTPSLAGLDHDVVLEIDLDGARQVKELHPEALLILLVAPSRELQEQRLRQRGDDDRDVAHRLELGEREERIGRQMADHVVINDDIDRAAGEVAGIIAGRRPGRSWRRDEPPSIRSD
jgi:guanylate kinase